MADKKITKLIAPTNISTESKSSAVITVTWEDPNPGASTPTAKSYLIYFVPRPGKPVTGKGKFTPPKIPVPKKVTIAGRKTPTFTVEIAAAAAPNGKTLHDDYLAYVIANGDGTKTENSPPGIQAYWHTTLGVTISIGGKSFTLTSDDASHKDGIYRLPFSKNDPFVITYADLAKFANSVGLHIPENGPDGKPIKKGRLNISKMAMNLPLRLFEIDIQLQLTNVSPIPGLKIEHLDLALERTDGVHPL